METPLSRQLQEAWLQTQMRKKHQQSSPSSPAYHLDSPLSSFDSSDNTSISNPDGFSSSSASLPPHFSDPHDDAPHLSDDASPDPALQFIKDMLLEEDLEDRTCMQVECTAYQATAKGFKDILGISDEASWGEPDLGLQQQQPEQGGSPGGGDDYQWVDNLLNSDDLSQVEQTLDVAERRALSAQNGSPPWSSDSSGSALFSSEQSSESTSQSSNEIAPPPWNVVASRVPTVEIPQSMDNFHNNKGLRGSALLDTGNRPRNGSLFQQGLNFGDRVQNFSPSHGSAQKKPHRRAVSDNMDSALNNSVAPTNVSRFKRAASEIDSGGNVAAWDTEGGESISFVQNKYLNAEVLGQMLQSSSICSEKPCMKQSADQREGGGGAELKGTRKLETTVDLMGLLLSCADAVASDDLPQANHILQLIRQNASPFGDGVQRLAHYFAEGLVARLSGTGARLYSAFTNNVPSAAKMLRAHHMYVEVNPSARVCHYFANSAILEAAEGAAGLHIVDYGILYGLQWPSLISALAGRKGGAPVLRITAIEFPQPGVKSAERVEMTGRRLAEYAKTYGVPFEYRAIASKWENVQPSSLNLKQDEVLVVNSMFRLRHLLDETVQPSNPRRTVLSRIRSMNPKVFVVGIKNGSYNSPFFKSRFREALSCLSYKFDMIDTTIPRDNQERLMMERELIGRDIINVIACEGPERVERPETYKQWQNRIRRAGFEQLPLDAKVVTKVRHMVKGCYHKHFGVEEDGKWSLLSWKGHILHGLSLWKPSSQENI